ncbi:hypothetical protein IBT47_10775 [Erwinia sp. S43]|uniref:Two-component-system connector protein AriR n=1 Tax=Pantoea coffeiphila TaxID=1465635 RepID=A0A2S9ICT6_9GAMM|nr:MULTISPECIES: biofilm development regulator YmgB/AriR family protein [Erwiniaceae]MBK0032765.1 hypothetical protein [Erwinia sp. S43]PRD15597.1 hypothetical protein CQW29_11390 [Pantoea coffeiphila]
MQQFINSSGSELISAFEDIDDIYAEEKVIFSMAVRTLLSEKGSVSSRDVLFYLIGEMDATTDVVRLDVLRTCMEILMGMKNPH